VLLGIELSILVIFAITALVKVYGGTAGPQAAIPQWSWLWPSGLGIGAFVSGVLFAVFILLGHSSLSFNEDAADPRHAPGRAAVLSTVVLVVNYFLITVGALAFAAGSVRTGSGSRTPRRTGTCSPGWAARCSAQPASARSSVYCWCLVLTSAPATTQATIIPAARTTLSMASHGALPKAFAKLHPKYETPVVSTWTFGLVSLVLFVLLTIWSENVLADSVCAVGLTIAIEYMMTSLACVWVFRRTLLASARNFSLRACFLDLAGSSSRWCWWRADQVRGSERGVDNSVRHRRRRGDRRGGDAGRPAADGAHPQGVPGLLRWAPATSRLRAARRGLDRA
jgi:amino acid transporter